MSATKTPHQSNGIHKPKTTDPTIVLIPWDPDSPEHIVRLKLQRIACGWKVEKVESWRDFQRTGKMGIHWIVYSHKHPEAETSIEKHITAFPDEATPLRDTCKNILQRPHVSDPEYATFVPLGHISLDTWSDRELHGLSREKGVCLISTFYVSKALQSGGLGRATMDCFEDMARDEFNAKAIVLDTFHPDEEKPDNPRRIAMKTPDFNVSPSAWYMRRGYVEYATEEDCWWDTDPTGKIWGIKAIYLRKELTS